MKLNTILKLLGAPHILAHTSIMSKVGQTHRAAWLAAAVRHRLLPFLATPRTVAEVAGFFEVGEERHEHLRAWLHHGVLLKELGESGGRYGLRSGRVKALAKPSAAVTAALVEGVIAIHHEGIYGSLEHIKQGRSLADLDHDLIARISELTAPLLEELLERELPTSGAHRHLELGCGHGRYVRYALAHNPEITAVGVDLDEGVAEQARALLAEAGGAERARVVAGSFLEVELQERFDTVSLFNLIYYIAPADRPRAIQKAADFLAPGGRLLLTSMGQGGQIGSSILNVWFASMNECGPLPTEQELRSWASGAGLSDVQIRRPLPGEAMFELRAVRPR